MNHNSSFKPSVKKKQERRIREEQKFLLHENSNFFLKEAYKTLRTNVNFALTDEERCKVITVTSSLRSEGKSITALNLSISFAQADKKVLVIDCDMRRPKVHRLLSVSSPFGLSNVLMDSSLLVGAILPVPEFGVDVLLAGDIPPNPSELLGSSRMENLLEHLKTVYDYIILDSPPVNMVTDAVVLAPLTSGILFVIRSKQTDKYALSYAMEQLEYAKVKVLGFVYNGAAMESVGSGYSGRTYKYGRYGGYGYRRYGYGRSYGYGRGYGYGYGGYGYGGYGYGYQGSGYNSGATGSNMPPSSNEIDSSDQQK